MTWHCLIYLAQRQGELAGGGEAQDGGGAGGRAELAGQGAGGGGGGQRDQEGPLQRRAHALSVNVCRK